MLMWAILATVMAVVTAYCAGMGSPTGDILRRIAPGAVDAAQAAISGYLAPWVWDELAIGVLTRPAWTCPAGLAVGFAVLAMLPSLRPSGRRSASVVTMAQPSVHSDLYHKLQHRL